MEPQGWLIYEWLIYGKSMVNIWLMMMVTIWLMMMVTVWLMMKVTVTIWLIIIWLVVDHNPSET